MTGRGDSHHRTFHIVSVTLMIRSRILLNAWIDEREIQAAVLPYFEGYAHAIRRLTAG
jgi:hypothetical protein